MALKPTRQQEHDSQILNEFSDARTLNSDALSADKGSTEISDVQGNGEKTTGNSGERFSLSPANMRQRASPRDVAGASAAGTVGAVSDARTRKAEVQL